MKWSAEEVFAALAAAEADERAMDEVDEMSDEAVARDLAAAGVDLDAMRARSLAAAPRPKRGSSAAGSTAR